MNQNIDNSLEKSLDDIVYYASLRSSRRSAENLYKGLNEIFIKLNDDLEMIIKDIEYIKLTLQQMENNRG